MRLKAKNQQQQRTLVHEHYKSFKPSRNPRRGIFRPQWTALSVNVQVFLKFLTSSEEKRALVAEWVQSPCMQVQIFYLSELRSSNSEGKSATVASEQSDNTSKICSRPVKHEPHLPSEASAQIRRELRVFQQAHELQDRGRQTLVSTQITVEQREKHAACHCPVHFLIIKASA